MSFAELAAEKIMDRLSIRYYQCVNLVDSPSPDLLMSELEIIDIINEAIAQEQYNTNG